MDIEKQKEFAKKYLELVKESNMKIVGVPKWILRDDGSYSLVVELSVREFNAGNNFAGRESPPDNPTTGG